MSEEMRLIQNNMQVIEELHHAIIEQNQKIEALENWKKEQYIKDFNYLNKEVCDRFNQLAELKSVLKERSDTILFILNVLENEELISFEGYNKHATKIVEKLSAKGDEEE